mmetsp:Transcript_4766/g.7802  ORF Transcript_4766/g.7802 Transcript_4766/m.7802 type:complete len:322 (-) Transcript_4766:168-1133(-)|eukprot:CAMPEP_0171485596 /NCGR_PEP_ID=MMETSP0958-20121227/631_1 /TAXON_ID=87120 /ORGANISM="Aurantiochytrium limacinum, Strain ATCCMYA-1381" /LENGTH=321 /DNA_ID=CAMNT_0012018399 /DNA_START=258 /DNA_END=1223 /DNA_ORIENTATION=-
MPAKKKQTRQAKKKAGTVPVRKNGVMDESDVIAFLEDLEVNFEARCQTTMFEAENAANNVRMAYKNELLMLPKTIRSMNVREFCDKYGGQINAVLEQDRQRVLESTGLSANGTLSPSAVVLQSAKAVQRSMSMRNAAKGSVPRFTTTPGSSLGLRNRAALGAHTNTMKQQQNITSTDVPLSTPLRGTGEGGLAPFSTPKFDFSVMNTPATAVAGEKHARPMRRGESIMSVNGSPLVATDTPGKPPRSTSKLAQDPTSFALSFGAKTLDLSDPNLVSKLADESDKNLAFSQLEAIKSEVARLMDSIKAGDTAAHSGEFASTS